MRTRLTGLPLRGPIVGATASAGLLLAFVLIQGSPQPDYLLDKLAVPLVRIMLFVGLGLLLGEIMEAAGWTRYLAWLAGPVFRFARLGPRCSASFTSAFFSGVTANAMLMNDYSQERITRRELFLTNFLNQLPAFFLHLPTTAFVIIPLTGRAGCIYLLLVFSAVLLRTAALVFYGRLRLPGGARTEEDQAGTELPKEKGASEILRQLRRRLPRRYLRIGQFVLPIYIGVSLLNVLGFFSAIRSWLSGTAVSSLLPVESLSMVVVAFLADYTSGFATAGALLDNGVLTVKQGVSALVLGNVLAFPLRALRHQLPRYLGIFNPGMGTAILFAGQSLRIVSLLLVVSIYYLLG